MREEKILLFTEKEEEFVDLLIALGIRKNSAAVLVFLANTPEATAREMERGTDMRQPEVSLAIKSLTERQWIRYHEIPSPGKGRPTKKYSLALPAGEIMAIIGREKRKDLTAMLGIIRKLRKDLVAIPG